MCVLWTICYFRGARRWSNWDDTPWKFNSSSLKNELGRRFFPFGALPIFRGFCCSTSGEYMSLLQSVRYSWPTQTTLTYQIVQVGGWQDWKDDTQSVYCPKTKQDHPELITEVFVTVFLQCSDLAMFCQGWSCTMHEDQRCKIVFFNG